MSVTGQGAYSDSLLLGRFPRPVPDADEEDAPISASTPPATATTRESHIQELRGGAPCTSFGGAIGASPPMRDLFATLARVAREELSVLLEGESGVGKDLLARAVHDRSARAKGPFVVVDCGAIAPNLIESELFGHERGAFTGAETSRRGVFDEASGGTLFLDEIGELPLDLQPKLLRALEQREVRSVGGRFARAIDVRVLAATNRKLGPAVESGRFRSDLFYRLAVVRATVPPLRERPGDILAIARSMLRAATKDDARDFPSDVAEKLVRYAWPGNVRELRNVVERYAVLGPHDGMFETAQPGGAAVDAFTDDELANLTYHEAKKRVMERFEETYLPRVLARAGGVVTRAAELAGVARPSFYRMLDRQRTPRAE